VRTTPAVLLLVLAAPSLVAETREVTAGSRYAAGGWFRVLFGSGYRDLWTTPIRAPVLDLKNEGGGLTAVRQVGRLQTLGLAMRGADGRAYTFRKLDKHPERILPLEWRNRFPAYIVQDATSRTHPAAAVILPVLAEAAGVPHTSPRLVVMPDDPALGEFREAFANQLGTFEEYPLAGGEGVPGFLGATEILSTRELWTRWQAGPETRVDGRAYLRARILDLWLDNYDRHGGQWRWMRIPGHDGLQALPEDPDMAFVHHDGLVMANVRFYNPRLLKFTGDYSRRLDGPLVQAFALDRWLLAGLEARDFEELARELQGRFTDEVIERALRRMPPEWHDLGGVDVAAALETRRAHLVDYIRRVYRYYAEHVDVHATDRAERVMVARSEGGTVEVTLALTGDEGSPYYRRHFFPGETREVRIFLHGGDDVVETTGPPNGPIRVRVIAGGGRKVIDDSRSGGTDVWRDAGAVEVRPGHGTKVRQKAWVDPHPSEDRPWARPRSWGHWTVPHAFVSWVPDLDLVVEAGFTRTSWGFRHHPNKTEQTVGGAVASRDLSVKAEYVGTFRRPASRFALGIRGLASGIERTNFYGFGNDTSPEPDRERYRSDERTLLLSPTVRYGDGHRFDVFLGGEIRYSDSPDEPGSGTILGEQGPYGAGRFDSLAVRAGLHLDTRERPGGSPRLMMSEGRIVSLTEDRVTGLSLTMSGLFVPQAWDAVESYGGLEGEVDAYVGPPRAHVALRMGGGKLWGTFAWFDAAFVGGPNARAYNTNRFAGDASLYGSVELRSWFGNLMTPVLPLRLGAFAFAETGRVWYQDEESKTWHGSYGGGVLLQPLGAPITIHATVATGDEGTRFSFGSGYDF
jgi:hypothetical protein